MFTGYHAPQRGVQARDVASEEVEGWDITKDRLRHRALVDLSSPVRPAPRGHRAHRPFVPAGGVLRQLHRDPSPAPPRRSEPSERTRLNGSLTPEDLRFSC